MHIQCAQISTMFEEEKATRINFFNLRKTFFKNETLNVGEGFARISYT